MSAHRIITHLYLPGQSPMKTINLPIRSTPKQTPYADWTMPDWEDNGWNKAMREVAHRLSAAGIPCVLLEDCLPIHTDHGAGAQEPSNGK